MVIVAGFVVVIVGLFGGVLVLIHRDRVRHWSNKGAD
jgi:hypothetical protein